MSHKANAVSEPSAIRHLDHHLQLHDEVIPIPQEADTVKLPIQVVILHRQPERITDKCHTRLDQP